MDLTTIYLYDHRIQNYGIGHSQAVLPMGSWDPGTIHMGHNQPYSDHGLLNIHDIYTYGTGHSQYYPWGVELLAPSTWGQYQPLN